MRNRIVVVAALGFMALGTILASDALAATLTWNNGYWNSLWDTSSYNWDDGTVLWNNIAPDNAIFGTTGVGTITISGNITAGNITFDTAGYSFSGDTLNLAGATPTINTNFAFSPDSVFGNCAIYSVIAGSNGLTKTGAGTLVLCGDSANTFTGTTTVSGGMLVLGKAYGVNAIGGNLTINESSGWPGNGVELAGDEQIPDSAVISFVGSSYDAFRPKGHTETIAGISCITGRGVIENASTTAIDPGTFGDGTLILNTPAGSSYSFNGYLRNNDGNPGIIAIVKNGLGTQTLVGGVIEYSGETKVNAGALVLMDTTSFKSPTTVAADGTLILNRTNSGYANRKVICNTITGTGTINVNCSTSGIAGGWVAFQNNSGMSNFTGTVNVNSGVLSMDGFSGAWSGNPTLNVNAGGLFAIRAQSVAVDGLNGTGDVFNSFDGNGPAGDTLTVGANNGSGTFSGVIHGSMSSGGTDGAIEQGILNLVKEGSGTQILSGANTYAGTTTVNAGALLLASGSLSANSAVTVASGAAFGGVGSAGIVSTTGGIINAGSQTGGVLALTGLNFGGDSTLNIPVLAGSPALLAVSGTLTISGVETINIVNTLPLAIGSYRLVSWGTLAGASNNFAIGTVPATPGVVRPRTYLLDTTHDADNYVGLNVIGDRPIWTGTNNSAWNLTTANNWVLANDGVTPTMFYASDAVTFSDLAANKLVVISGGDVSPASVDFTHTSGVYTLSGSNGIIGATGLTVSGGGNLVISNANTFTGNTTISAGSIRLANSLALQNSTLTTGGITFDSAVNGHAFTLGGLRGGGDIALSDGVIPVALSIGNNGLNTEYTGVLSGAGSLTKIGSGTTTLSGVNTYAGNTTISAGTLTLGNAGAIPSGAGKGNVILNGTLDLNGNIATVNGLSGSGIVTSGISGAAMLTVANNQPSSFSGVLQDGNGSISLTKTGTGELTLTGANTFSGNTTVSAGSLRLSNSLALQNSTLAGGMVVFDPAVSSHAFALGGLSTSNNLALTDGTNPIALTVGNNGTDTQYSGVLSGPGSLTKSGSGRLTLSGDSANTYAGTTTMSGGILVLAKTAGVNAIGGDLTISPSLGWPNSGVELDANEQIPDMAVIRFAGTDWCGFRPHGNTETIAGLISLEGKGVIENRRMGDPAVLGTGTIVLNTPNGGNYLYSGYIRDYDSGSNGGAIALIKNGLGTQALVGDNVAYTGLTTINAGTLTLQDTGNFNSPISLAANGTLNLARNIAGFANRRQISGYNITGTGVINVNNAGPGLDGGWSLVTGSTLNFDGTINVNSGVFATDVYATVAGSATVNVAAGAVFSNHHATGGVTIGALNGSGDVTPAQNMDLTLNLTVGAGDKSGSFAGVIHGNNSTGYTDGSMEAGTLTLTKIGSGTQKLGGANTFSGSTTVKGGTLLLANSLALQASPVKVVGGTIAFDSSVTTHAFSIPSLNGSSNIILQDNASTPNGVTLTFGGDNTDMLYTGVFSGAGGLVKEGAGELTLASASSHSGPTRVNAGKLNLQNSLPNSSVSMGYYTTLSHTNIGTVAVKELSLDYYAAIELGSAADYSTSPAINVTGMNGLSASGYTPINIDNSASLPGGTYQLIAYKGTIGEYGFGSFVLNTPLPPQGRAANPPKLVDNAANHRIDLYVEEGRIKWAGGTGDWQFGGPTNWKFLGATTDFRDNDVVVFDNSVGSGTTTVNIAADVTPAEVVFNGSKNYDINGAAGIGNNAAMTTSLYVAMDAGGSVTLNNANSYANGTTLKSGKLNVNNASALATGMVKISGGTLDNTSGAPIALSNAGYAINGDFTFAGTNDLDLGTGSVTLSGTPTITTTAGKLTIGGNIQGSSGFTKAGAGVLALSGGNTYSGDTSVNGGVLSAINALQIPAGTINVANGATIDFAPVNETNRSLDGRNFVLAGTGSDGNGALQVNIPAGTTAYANMQVGNVKLAADATVGIFGHATTNPTYNGIHFGEIGGKLDLNGHALTVRGDGSAPAFFWGVNDYVIGTGSIVVEDQGVLVYISGSTQNWTGGAITVKPGAILASGGAGSSTTPLVIDGGMVGSYSDTATYTGSVTLNNNMTVYNEFLGANGSATIFQGVVSGVGGIINLGGATTLAGANTFAGDTTVADGTILLANSLALQNSTLTTGGVAFDSSVSSHAFTLGGLTGSSDLALQDNAATPNAVQLLVGNNNQDTIYSGALSGPGSLGKVGAGQLTLTGSLVYTGDTNVYGGALSVDGALTNSATVNVYNTAVLTAGSITADTLSIGGTPAIAPSTVPEPCTMVLLALGVLALFAIRKRV
jgi:autotransporter-associated beta strand protein